VKTEQAGLVRLAVLKKWMPVLGKDHAQKNNLERDDDSKTIIAL
jgi:hypothetical protein